MEVEYDNAHGACEMLDSKGFNLCGIRIWSIDLLTPMLAVQKYTVGLDFPARIPR